MRTNLNVIAFLSYWISIFCNVLMEEKQWMQKKTQPDLFSYIEWRGPL